MPSGIVKAEVAAVGWVIGWWTLKFQNGAIIRYRRYEQNLANEEVFWVGKKYQVIKEGVAGIDYFIKLIGEPEVEKKELEKK